MKSVEEEIPIILKKAAGADGIPSKFSFSLLGRQNSNII